MEATVEIPSPTIVSSPPALTVDDAGLDALLLDLELLTALLFPSTRLEVVGDRAA